MGKNYVKKEGNASVIFIWILIILLAVGTFFVIKNYKDGFSDFIASEGIEEAFSQTLGKPAGKITKDELASVEGAQMYAIGDSSFAIYYLKGYSELTAEDDSSKYVVQANISADEFLNELPLFTGIKSFAFQNYNEGLVFDMNKLSADTYKNIEEFYAYGLVIDNSDLINTHTNLKTLGMSGAGLVNIPEISALKNLEYVDFSDNSITDISALSILDNEKITNVILSGNEITDFAPISHIDETKITKAEETTEEVTEETTEEVTEETTEEVTEETAEEVTEETTEEVTEETTEEATEEVTEETTEEVAEEVTEEVTEETAE